MSLRGGRRNEVRRQMIVNGIPISHGMEVEQCESQVPSEILNDSEGRYFGNWHRDGSGPREIEAIGPSKQVGRLIKQFNETMRQYDDNRPWNWTNQTQRGSGCGSHAHLSFEQDGATDEEKVEGYTIAYNTAVELTPFLAPFWAYNWEDGFRSSASRWAAPQTTRFSTSTMEQRLNSPRGRSYDAVTLNPPRSGGKPMTIELRLSETPPAFALVGLTFLRRVMTKAMKGGWSPKIAGDRNAVLNDVYSKIYNAQRHGGLFDALKATDSITFEEDRGLPGTDKLEFDNAWEVLKKILTTNGTGKGNYDDRVKKLVKAAGSGEEFTDSRGRGHYHGGALGPQRNDRAFWHTTDDDFSWDIGPEVA